MIASWQESDDKPSQYVEKQRHYSANKLLYGKVFPVVMYNCEGCTIKKAGHQRIDAFELDAGEDSWKFVGQQGD